jgi:serine/threonine protein kinase
MAQSSFIGRYQIEQELGRGGMAVVFLARDPLMNRRVAVKVLPRQFTYDESFLQRFQREARVIATLEHPAIVPVYDFGEHDGQPYLVMRYMPGGSLSDRLEKGPLPLPEAAAILNHLAPALDEAHARGMVHRDLKPANVLFDHRRRPYLCDFGIVKLSEGSATALTATGGVVGTPAYMSPEQVRGDVELDGRTDVYSLGVILYEMLTGDKPYHADTPMGLAMKHVLEPVPRILERRPDLPPDCEAVITRALAKEREGRFPTATALAAATANVARARRMPAGRVSGLEPVTAPPSRPAPAPPPETPVRSPESRRRVPRWLLVVAAVACLVVAGLAGRAVVRGLRPSAPAVALATASPSVTRPPVPTPTASATPTPTPDLTVTWAVLDSDGDGLSDQDEAGLYLTDPSQPDTDGDGLRDGDEVSTYRTDPVDGDTDDDGWPDGREVEASLERFGAGDVLCPAPYDPDSDQDGIPDALDPDPCGPPTLTPLPSFALGGQVAGGDHLAEMRSAGMTWLKRAVRFSPGSSAADLADDIDTWHQQGFRVLLSVLGQREDLERGADYYDEYAAYVGGLAEAGADAIEVLNLMNVMIEWPAGQIDPEAYVDLLARASGEIRSRAPGVLVISGALAPTGFDDEVNAWADDRYLAGMAAAGADRFVDCIGVQYTSGAISPAEAEGDPRGDHRTYYFWGMVDTYWEAFDGRLPLCFTGLGYLSPEDLGPPPSAFIWSAETTAAQQARWLAEAVSLAASSGKVKMLIIWNVDFETYGEDPQAGYAILRPDGTCPACETLQAVMTP